MLIVYRSTPGVAWPDCLLIVPCRVHGGGVEAAVVLPQLRYLAFACQHWHHEHPALHQRVPHLLRIGKEDADSEHMSKQSENELPRQEGGGGAGG